MPTNILRDDILPSDLTTEKVRILVRHQFNQLINSSRELPNAFPRSRTPGEAKTLNDFYHLVQLAITSKLDLEGANEDAQLFYTEEFSDIEQNLETLTFSLVERLPGHYSEGPPMGGDVRNFRPMLREVKEDPDNPGYQRAVFGMWYDNIVRFTCWARTNRTANARAFWFEELMEDYKWFFIIRGVRRVLFWRRNEDLERDTTQTDASTTNKYYGRPLEYFVKTEKIRVFTEKELENIILNVNVKTK